MGRSPRVRGSREPQPARRNCYRSIPACAGEPHRFFSTEELVEVDPRVCGGADLRRLAVLHIHGRSPRVRGSRPPAER